QEACFLAGDDYRAFLERRGLRRERGAVVDEGGRVVGEHDGHWRFTPGQRRGLGVSAPEPVYALPTHARTNTVVGPPPAALARDRVTAPGRLFVPAERVDAKLRYRAPAVPARVEAGSRRLLLELDEPVFGVAPGQTAVLYEGDAVVGAGVISV